MDENENYKIRINELETDIGTYQVERDRLMSGIDELKDSYQSMKGKLEEKVQTTEDELKEAQIKA